MILQVLPVIITPKGTLQRVSGRSVSQTSFVDVGYDADKNQLVRHVTDVGNPSSQWWGVTVSRRRKKMSKTKKRMGSMYDIMIYLPTSSIPYMDTKPCFFPTEKDDDVFFFFFSLKKKLLRVFFFFFEVGPGMMVTWKRFGPPYKSFLRHAAMK